MPVFDTAAAFRASKGPSTYLQTKALRSQIAGNDASTEFTKKKVASYDEELAIAKQAQDTKASAQLLRMQEYFDKVNDEEVEMTRNAMAAALEADDAGEDPTEALLNSIDTQLPGGRNEVIKKFPDLQYDRAAAEAAVMTADERLMRSRGDEKDTTVVSLDEKLAMGMPKEWAENAVVEKDQDGNLSFNNRPTGMTEGDLALRGGLSDSGLNKVTIDYRDKAQVAALTATTATEMVRVVNRSPAALAKSGAIIKFGNEIYSTAKNLIEVANKPELPASETAKQNQGPDAFDWTAFDSSIEKLGVLPEDAARLQAGLYSLAFSAAVGEQGSRPSDKDIQAYIKIYGGEITNANGFKAVIAQAMRRQRNGLYFMAEMNPEIIDPDVQMKVFDREYAKFLDALDGGKPPAGQGPNIGDVDGGYRFIGGDPSIATSWEKI